MKLTFLGAAQSVTGSKYLLEAGTHKILIDCGLFQGKKKLRLRNWDTLPIDPSSIDAVILTHAHIDHTGYLPLLIQQGFKGPVYCTQPTADLCAILLPDAGHIHEEDARRAKKYGYSKHRQVLPLYTEAQGKRAAKKCIPIDYGQPINIDNVFSVTFSRAGHILGSSHVTIQSSNRTIVFSGDLGRQNSPFLKKPAKITNADYVVVESTYASRNHSMKDPMDELEYAISRAIKKEGKLIIPAFAVGRAQAILYYIYHLKLAQRIPKDIPVFLDSPMAVNATKLLIKHHREHQLSQEECEAICSAAMYLKTPEDSKRINDIDSSAIVISASGMATGGRVLHHLKNCLPHAKHTVVFAGFQAAGTRGEKLIAGASSIKIHGQDIPVHAQIMTLETLSSHADGTEIKDWLRHLQKPPSHVFITHGEPDSAFAFKETLEAEFGWKASVPDYQDTVKL